MYSGFNMSPEQIEKWREQYAPNADKKEPEYQKNPNAVDTGTSGDSPLGTLTYGGSDYDVGSLPPVADPDKAFSDVAMRQHEIYMREFRPFEEALIGTLDDTSLVDAVPGDVETQTRIAQGVAERNRQRYGYTQTAVERTETGREMQRGTALNLAGGLNTGRLAQRERNQSLLSELVNLSQGINTSVMGQMGAAAEGAVTRKNAYTQAKAASKAQRWGFIGSILSAI